MQGSLGDPVFRSVLASGIRAPQRHVRHLKSPSQICFCTRGIRGRARAIINNMTAPDVMTGRNGDDGRDRDEGIGISEEIQDPSVWAAVLEKHSDPFP